MWFCIFGPGRCHRLIVPWWCWCHHHLHTNSNEIANTFSSHLPDVIHWEFLEGREERSEKDHNLKIKSDEFMTILWWWFYDGMMIWWRNDFLMMIPLWGEVCWCWCTPRWAGSRKLWEKRRETKSRTTVRTVLGLSLHITVNLIWWWGTEEE